MKSIFAAILLIFCIQMPNAMAGDATWYNLGMTACGQVFSNNDYVAAIAYSYWTTPNPNNVPMCNRRARVIDPSNGRSVEVSIKDKCASCGRNDIDLSPAAFKQLRNLDVGRFNINWNFI